jgi:hypothetical protein
MKKNVFLILSSLLLILTLGSCSKSQNTVLRSSNGQATNNSSTIASKPEYYLFYAHWDSWGTAKHDCNGGWGLCHFKACFNCTKDDAKKEDKYFAPIQIDSTTNIGTFTIELDPSDSASGQAISNQSDFTVDENIVSDDDNGLIVQAGIYPFIPSIGTNGGYVLNVIKQ